MNELNPYVTRVSANYSQQSTQVPPNPPQLAQPRNTIPGRIINSNEEVMPAEVPLDGTIGLFLKNDLTCIYAKQWNSDGTITTVPFLRKQSEPTKEEKDVTQPILERLDRLEELLTKTLQNRGTNSRNSKKEDVSNE